MAASTLRGVLAPVLGSFLVALVGCSAAPAEEKAEQTEDSIIGGVDAPQAGFNAIGALGNRWGSQYRSFCTATLISPTVVLTARHCGFTDATNPDSASMLDQGAVYFLVGPNSRQPIKAVKATAVTPSNIFFGGYTTLGSDVAFYTLSTPITDIAPLKVASSAPSQADVGAAHIAIGYGIQDALGRSGTRKTGQVTLRAVSGAPAPLAFGTLDQYIAWIAGQAGVNPTSFTAEERTALEAMYQNPLLNDYEAYVGAAAQDVQVCNGDSGGPLLRQVNGQLVVVGVASTTISKEGNLCSHGGIYAVFGADTRNFIAKAIGEECFVDANNVMSCGAASGPHECPIFTAEAPAPNNGTVPNNGTTPNAGTGTSNGNGAGTGTNNGGATPNNGTALTPEQQAAQEAFLGCLAGSCCGEVSACFGNEDCATLSACFQSCSAPPADGAAAVDPTTCSQACYAANRQAYGRYQAYANCASSCSPQQ